ncbi:Zn-ribbon domain-containing OB-fold protein [Aldersonia kunmingensis]|uniref:Zn-ribbon domain-containing OB-fold protein n=1 Tax=Aldersonia kunmingensis TaxID=408066 RepID=UPI00082C640B|nr:OB-fold domain-containing protein [Aldersonia kunmingensis]
MSELGVGRPTKRRAGSAVGGLPVADSRPVLDGDAVLGSRCTLCRYASAQRNLPWCPVCYGELEPARFPRTGRTWSSTVVAIPVGTRKPPFGLAYVDLDDGPRVLVHLDKPAVLELGARVQISGTDDGDLVAGAEVQR